MPAISPPSPLPSCSAKTQRSISLASKYTPSSICCELKNSSSPQNWTVDCVSSSDPIHIIIKPPNSIPMSSLLNSSLKNSKRVCLFHCSEMKDLAERIASESDAIELRSISWRAFEDGFPNLFISNAQGVRGQHVAFLASFSSPGVIFEQLSIIYALPKLFVSSFTLVLPFFPTGTSERMEDEGDVATAFTLARILSNIPISRGGPASLVIFDIHALQERFYFGDNILPCFESGIPLLLNRLQQLPDSDNITIAFPDDGAWKRFHKQLQHFPMIVCAKVREGDQRIVRLKEGDPKGRHVVIVDDLVQSGGTLIECQKVLANHGAAKISAYVTHGIFPNKSWERFKHDDGGNHISKSSFDFIHTVLTFFMLSVLSIAKLSIFLFFSNHGVVLVFTFNFLFPKSLVGLQKLFPIYSYKRIGILEVISLELANFGCLLIPWILMMCIFLHSNISFKDYRVESFSVNPSTGMSYFWITDSCPQTVKQVKNKPPFEVLSLAAVIASTLQV